MVAAIVLLSACTSDAVVKPESDRSPASPPSARPFVLRVVATTTGPRVVEDQTFVDGIRVGERVVNREGIRGRRLQVVVADDGGDPHVTASLIQEAVSAPGTSAVLVVGPARAVVAARGEIEATRTPVVLLGGDLYSGRDLFRQAFQTSIPYRWQAAAMARYLVKDRGYDRVVLVTQRGPGAEVAGEAFAAAMAEEGADPALRLPLFPASNVPGLVARMRTADAVAYFGGPTLGGRLARGLDRLSDPPQLVTSSPGLSEPSAGPQGLTPGTVAPYLYTWAGWAEPIRRVGTFRDVCVRRLGHEPLGFEQEGYDAVRLVADALRSSNGHGGDTLVRALEAFDEELYSSLPIALGPDDHLLYSDRQLGLFAVAGPGEDVEPWAPDWAAWRPVMRTFTSNGERTTVIDRDKDVFFPGWKPREPAPDFWTSRYGITSRGGDPLH